MATEFRLPEVGEGVSAGTVVRLLVKVGDEVAVDQPVLELETDKAVVEVPSTVAGRVESIAVKENEEAKVGQVVLTVGAADAADSGAADSPAPSGSGDSPPEGESGKGDRAAAAPSGGGASGPGEPRDGAETGPLNAGPRRPLPEPATGSGSGPGGGTLIPAAPSVRRLARERGVDIRQVQGSGILGRVGARDVLRFEDGAQAESSAVRPHALPLPDFSRWGEVERRPMNGVRKATVRAMSAAWATVPMVTHFDKADVTEFERLRKRHAARVEAAGAKLTPTAMLLKIVAAALRKFPDFNASIDVEKQEIVYKRYVNIGVAVDTDAGLLVPVIRDADRKNVIELARELGEMAARARDRKLSLEQMQGGNFSISNLGGIGGTGFTPIVNPPDVAILGVSRASFEPVYDRERGEFEPRQMMPLSLSYDHRLIDGASAARFLRWVCAAVEDPFTLMLEG